MSTRLEHSRPRPSHNTNKAYEKGRNNEISFWAHAQFKSNRTTWYAEVDRTAQLLKVKTCFISYKSGLLYFIVLHCIRGRPMLWANCHSFEHRGVEWQPSNCCHNRGVVFHGFPFPVPCRDPTPLRDGNLGPIGKDQWHLVPVVLFCMVSRPIWWL